jgi:uncharacterized protein YabE (DUF348 family)
MKFFHLSPKGGKLRLGVLSVLALALLAGSLAYFRMFTYVTVYADGQELGHFTTAGNVQGVLGELGFELRKEDYVAPSLFEPLRWRMGIVVIKAQPYLVNHDGEETLVWSVGKKVADILRDAGISYYQQDMVLPPAETPAGSQQTISVVRVKARTIEEQIVLAYAVRRVPNPGLFRGQERLVQTGLNGKIVNTIQIVYHDGQAVERQVLNSKEVIAKRDQIIEYGTISTISRGGYSIQLRRVVDVIATAYCSGTAGSGCPTNSQGHAFCTGPYNNGLTSIGMRAKQGKGTWEDPYIVAVDPRLIPLRSRMYLQFPGGRVVTGHGVIIKDGFAIAADVGSAIKGNRIDILFDNHWVAFYFGRRQVRVFVVEDARKE